MRDYRHRRRKKIDFLLENNHYRRLHLILYLSTITLILTIYYFLVFLFSENSVVKILMIIISLGIGIYLVFRRDDWVKFISDYYEDKRRKKIKAKNQEGKKTTLKKIAPKNKSLKLDIKKKISPSERLKSIKTKLSSDKNKPKKDYIEIKD